MKEVRERILSEENIKGSWRWRLNPQLRQSIEVKSVEAMLTHTTPMPPSATSSEAASVLAFVASGPPANA